MTSNSGIILFILFMAAAMLSPIMPGISIGIGIVFVILFAATAVVALAQIIGGKS